LVLIQIHIEFAAADDKILESSLISADQNNILVIYNLLPGGSVMSIVEESEFKGNAMIVLKNDEEDKYPFQFGVKKAKLVLENIEAIKNFVEKHDK
jgi:hypothetical protein